MNIANRITFFRILLVPFFIATLLYYRPHAEYLRFMALGIFLIAGISDAIDGFIARRLHQISELGTLLDPLADKCLLISAFICLSLIKTIPPEFRLPAWALIIVISRDIILIAGTAIIYLQTNELVIAPSRLGKVTTFLQISTIIALLAAIPHHQVIRNITIIVTLLSGFDYVRRGARKLET